MIPQPKQKQKKEFAFLKATKFLMKVAQLSKQALPLKMQKFIALDCKQIMPTHIKQRHQHSTKTQRDMNNLKGKSYNNLVLLTRYVDLVHDSVQECNIK